MLAVASEILPFSLAQYITVRFPRYKLVNCMRYCNVSLVKVSQLPLPTTVVRTHINIMILRVKLWLRFKMNTLLLWVCRLIGPMLRRHSYTIIGYLYVL
jgi:hypothetical protein